MNQVGIVSFLFGMAMGIIIFKIKPRKHKRKLIITFFYNDFKIEGFMKKVTLTTTQFVTGKLTPKNKKGEAASIETADYSSDNTTVAEVIEEEGNEYGFRVNAVGIGTAQITVTADADLGEGVVTLTTIFEVEVIPAQAESLDVEIGAPEEQG